MKKEDIEALQWFVDFANLNLDNLKPGDKAKFFIEAKQYLWPVEEELQEIENMDVSWVLAGLPKEDSEQYWRRMRDLQATVRTVLDPFAYDLRIGKKFNTRMIVKTSWEQPDGLFALSCFSVADSHPEYVEVKLYSLLAGLPLSAVRRCPGCQKFFLNPTRRKKEFCGNRCMWRIITSKRRAEDREGYNEYQKKLTKDQRREKAGLKRLHTKPRKIVSQPSASGKKRKGA